MHRTIKFLYLLQGQCDGGLAICGRGWERGSCLRKDWGGCKRQEWKVLDDLREGHPSMSLNVGSQRWDSSVVLT